MDYNPTRIGSSAPINPNDISPPQTDNSRSSRNTSDNSAGYPITSQPSRQILPHPRQHAAESSQNIPQHHQLIDPMLLQMSNPVVNVAPNPKLWDGGAARYHQAIGPRLEQMGDSRAIIPLIPQDPNRGESRQQNIAANPPHFNYYRTQISQVTESGSQGSYVSPYANAPRHSSQAVAGSSMVRHTITRQTMQATIPAPTPAVLAPMPAENAANHILVPWQTRELLPGPLPAPPFPRLFYEGVDQPINANVPGNATILTNTTNPPRRLSIYSQLLQLSQQGDPISSAGVNSRFTHRKLSTSGRIKDPQHSNQEHYERITCQNKLNGIYMDTGGHIPGSRGAQAWIADASARQDSDFYSS